jgi:NADPH:quinone reductase-like Zn-dependent oxidoreductase
MSKRNPCDIPVSDNLGDVAKVGAGVARFKPSDAVVAFIDLKRAAGYFELAVGQESVAALRSRSPGFAEDVLPIAGDTPRALYDAEEL